MIKVYKDLDDVPISLRTDPESIARNPAKTTNQRRLELIKEAAYPKAPSASKFDCRYKLSDIKEKLQEIYHGKCAYCESSMEQLEVEHYRPKRGGYYWLAYSWDNLLLACPKCNQKKRDDFPIQSERVRFDADRDVIEGINTMSALYDRIEQPLIINPETASDQLLGTASFDKNGRMFSDDKRMMETIKACNLDRKALREKRKKILDDLVKDIRLAVYEAGDNKGILNDSLSFIVKCFVRKLNDVGEPYIAFRRCIITHRLYRQ